MKCPLLFTTLSTAKDVIGIEVYDCLKEECAWWVKETKRCCLTRIDEWLGEIGYELDCIKNVLYKQVGEEVEVEIIKKMSKE